MSATEYTFCDRSGWASGPWDNEPDKISWTDPDTGLPCLIRRHDRSGVLCGYVGIHEGHPLHAVEWDLSGPTAGLEAHGEINYSARCQDTEPEESGICHVAQPGEPDVWWFGFDCGHAWDTSPRDGHRFDDTYRSVPYVRGICERLAAQLSQIGASS